MTGIAIEPGTFCKQNDSLKMLCRQPRRSLGAVILHIRPTAVRPQRLSGFRGEIVNVLNIRRSGW